jgi:flagellar biogenesis protein FliO
MTRALFLCAFFLFASLTANAAEITYKAGADNFTINLNFTGSYTGVEARQQDNQIILYFQSAEPLNFDKIDFYEAPVKSVWHTEVGNAKQVHFDFEGEVVSPKVVGETKSITLIFPVTAPVLDPAEVASAVPGVGAYIRMFTGLLVILVIILVGFAVMKFFFKHNLVSDIPGTGRLLGKIDIEMKKSLVFYELGEIIYMLSMTDSNIRLVDKITDPADVNLLKAGFARKKDFSSYLRFFRKSNEIKDEIKNTSEVLEEKISSLRKK